MIDTNVVLSRRVAKLMHIEPIKNLGVNERFAFAEAVDEANDFSDLPANYQQLIILAERNASADASTLKHLSGQHNQKKHGYRGGVKVSSEVISGLGSAEQSYYKSLPKQEQVKFRLAWYREIAKNGLNAKQFTQDFEAKRSASSTPAPVSQPAPKAPKAPKAVAAPPPPPAAPPKMTLAQAKNWYATLPTQLDKNRFRTAWHHEQKKNPNADYADFADKYIAKKSGTATAPAPKPAPTPAPATPVQTAPQNSLTPAATAAASKLAKQQAAYQARLAAAKAKRAAAAQAKLQAKQAAAQAAAQAKQAAQQAAQQAALQAQIKAATQAATAKPIKYHQYDDRDANDSHRDFHNNSNWQQWKASLTSQEFKSLYDYVNDKQYYKDVNDILRNPTRAFDPNAFPNSRLTRGINALDAVTNRGELQRDTILFRGRNTSKWHNFIGDDGQPLKVGQIITDAGFGSTATKRDTSMWFATEYKYPPNPAMLRIKAPKGTKGAYTSYNDINPRYMHETEFLVPRNMKYKVTGMHYENIKYTNALHGTTDTYKVAIIDVEIVP